MAGSVGDLTHEATKTVATTALGAYSPAVSFRGLGPSSEFMAYYGIPSAGQALTAASTNDKITIKDLGGTDISAQSLYGADGNDVISLGAAGITATASAKIVVPNLADYLGTGAAKGGFISGNGGNGYLISGDVLLHGSAGTVYTGEGSIQISAMAPVDHEPRSRGRQDCGQGAHC